MSSANGIVVPHASGARVVVTDLHIESAWRDVIEGVPGEKYFARGLARAGERWPGREVRVRGTLHPPLSAEDARSAHTRDRDDPPRRHAPRWFVSAAANVDDARDERGARAMTFVWCTNGPFLLSVEELLASMHDMALDGDIAAVPPDAIPNWPSYTSLDGVTVYVDSLTLRFVVERLPHDALYALTRAHSSPLGPLVSVPLIVDGVAFDVVNSNNEGDAVVLAGADLSGPGVDKHSQAYLGLAWSAPSPGDAPLGNVLRDVMSGIAWHKLAAQSLGP